MRTANRVRQPCSRNEPLISPDPRSGLQFRTSAHHQGTLPRQPRQPHRRHQPTPPPHPPPEAPRESTRPPLHRLRTARPTGVRPPTCLRAKPPHHHHRTQASVRTMSCPTAPGRAAPARVNLWMVKPGAKPCRSRLRCDAPPLAAVVMARSHPIARAWFIR